MPGGERPSRRLSPPLESRGSSAFVGPAGAGQYSGLRAGGGGGVRLASGRGGKWAGRLPELFRGQL